MNILLIEDDPSHLKLARLVLSWAGHKVSAAEADAASDAIKQERPQVVLLDLELPGTDGLTLARKLKADPETRDIQIVGITSYMEKYSRAEALKAGCDAYLVKPINTRTLAQQLSDVVAKKSSGPA
jgi:CheY-like chemotaxis protein